MTLWRGEEEFGTIVWELGQDVPHLKLPDGSRQDDPSTYCYNLPRREAQTVLHKFPDVAANAYCYRDLMQRLCQLDYVWQSHVDVSISVGRNLLATPVYVGDPGVSLSVALREQESADLIFVATAVPLSNCVNLYYPDGESETHF